MSNTPAPVVVCVDGSDAAIAAAVWAVDEAISRDVALRMVHVVHADQPAGDVDDACGLDVQYAESAMRAATAAVEATGKPVKLETEILRGEVESALIDESSRATLMCVGSVGIGVVARAILGSTAASLAESAYCPVAVIRSPCDVPRGSTGWIVVAVDDRDDNAQAIEFAMAEARLRTSPVLMVGVAHREFGDISYDELDRRVETWRRHYPDVHMSPVTSGTSIARYLGEHNDEMVELAVIGRADADAVTDIIGPHHPLAQHGGCSVVVVR